MNAPANIDSATLHSIELEQEILGVVLVTNSALEIIEREVSAEDFPNLCTDSFLKRSPAFAMRTG